MTKFRTWGVVLGGLTSLSVFSCTENIEVGRNHASSGNAGNGGASSNSGGTSAAGSGGLPPHVCQPATCQGKSYQCGDCIDNDGDQLVDSDDPECTGPCDNTEDSYYGGIPGQNNAPCRQDCYFDSDTGAGNDECYWSHDCDPLSVSPDFPPSADSHCAYNPNANIPGSSSSCEELSATQASLCVNTCLPITPNGCDCFGCCELPADSKKFVWIGSASSQGVGTCDAAHVDDPAACHPCTPVPSCFNACDPCEVCVGRTSPAASCGSNSPPRCGDSAAACGQPGEPDCDAGYYCITGCCAEAPR